MVAPSGLRRVVRRIEFDHAFAKIAMARGIEIREGCAVARSTVAETASASVETGQTIAARAIVGADGVARHRPPARRLPRGELRAQVVELDTEGVARRICRATPCVFDFTSSDLRGYAWDFPTVVDGKPLDVPRRVRDPRR